MFFDWYLLSFAGIKMGNWLFLNSMDLLFSYLKTLIISDHLLILLDFQWRQSHHLRRAVLHFLFFNHFYFCLPTQARTFRTMLNRVVILLSFPLFYVEVCKSISVLLLWNRYHSGKFPSLPSLPWAFSVNRFDIS